MQKTFISAISLQAPGNLKKFTYHRMDLNSKTIGRQVFRLCQSLQNIWGSERKMFV